MNDKNLNFKLSNVKMVEWIISLILMIAIWPLSIGRFIIAVLCIIACEFIEYCRGKSDQN